MPNDTKEKSSNDWRERKKNYCNDSSEISVIKQGQRTERKKKENKKTETKRLAITSRNSFKHCSTKVIVERKEKVSKLKLTNLEQQRKITLNVYEYDGKWISRIG